MALAKIKTKKFLLLSNSFIIYIILYKNPNVHVGFEIRDESVTVNSKK